MSNNANSYTESEKYYVESVGDETASSMAASPSTPHVPDHSAAIPIPRRSLAVDLIEEIEPAAVADVTEENWFENERQGSLNQEQQPH